MNNRQWTILEVLKEQIEKQGGTKYVGYYPDAMSLIGANMPACMLADGNESTYLCMPGATVRYEYAVSIILIVPLVDGVRIRDALAYQNMIQNAISIAAEKMAGIGVISMKFVSVDKGDISQGAEMSASGYLPQVTVRRIDVLFTVEDSLL